MPHIVIEYSSNLHDRIGLNSLMETLHETAIATGVFPRGGARTRACERTRYRIADGHPDNGFVHVVLRIGHGRDPQTKQRAGQTVFDALCAHLKPLYDAAPLAISFEIQEIDPVLNFKQNNLHEYLKARAEGRHAPEPTKATQ
ncbi:MAG TPA: 5-carboxymethyl-2-hydroxymuconate Delta-isomerase [Burkholderiaceae bacterium]|nr:5-carboxymethyl-2-hydroxymuconate Delta-isomerase [Burkholderiaceae bacterium]